MDVPALCDAAKRGRPGDEGFLVPRTTEESGAVRAPDGWDAAVEHAVAVRIRLLVTGQQFDTEVLRDWRARVSPPGGTMGP